MKHGQNNDRQSDDLANDIELTLLPVWGQTIILVWVKD